MKVTVIPIVIGVLGTVTKGLVLGLEDYPTNKIVKIGQNTKESPGDLRRLAIIQTSVRSYQLT